MQVSFIRSSSYNNYDFCSHQYFLNYVLGIPSKAGKKANQGTTVHKVMEVLANCKKTIQANPDQEKYQFFDDQIGLVEWTSEDFLKPQKLNNMATKLVCNAKGKVNYLCHGAPIGSDDRCNVYNYDYNVQGVVSYGAGFICNVDKEELFNQLPKTIVRQDGKTVSVGIIGIIGTVEFKLAEQKTKYWCTFLNSFIKFSGATQYPIFQPVA